MINILLHYNFLVGFGEGKLVLVWDRFAHVLVLSDPAEVGETEILECNEGDDTPNQVEETGHNGVPQDVGDGGAHLGFVFGHLLSSEKGNQC